MLSISDISIVRRVEAFLETSQKPLIVILGPTASGKTGFSIELARQIGEGNFCRGELVEPRTEAALSSLDSARDDNAVFAQGIERTVEIVNADSRQFYKGLDIGTAKITREEMEGIPHYLIDVLDPKERATISWYQKVATKVIHEIHERGHVPMLVGGSMLYISAIIDGLQPLRSDPEIRKKLEAEYDGDHGTTLQQHLKKLDPESAAAIPIENKVYLVRALEIAEMGGRSASSQKRRLASPFDLFIIGIQRPRSELIQRIHDRIDAMFARGWVGEVRALLEKGYRETDPGFESHGYREIAEFLKKHQNCHTEPCRSATIRRMSWFDPSACIRAGSAHHDMLKATIARKSVQYAKRQMTWWRKDKRVRWIGISSTTNHNFPSG